MNDEPLHFPKVYYKLKTDTLNLEKMMTDFGVNNSDQNGSPFFELTNPKESDTISLKTKGLRNREFNTERYRRIMFELYPEEINELRIKYMIPAQLP